MDDANLKELLRDTSNRQFWIKPWGSRDFPNQPDAQPGTQFFAAPQLEITFAKGKNPWSIQEGDVFLVYHVRCPTWMRPSWPALLRRIRLPLMQKPNNFEKMRGEQNGRGIF